MPGGRPIFVTDITDPADPQTFPEPVDTGRDDGRTAYAHDVQVDSAGFRLVGRTLGDGPQPGHRPPGDVLLATEEVGGTPDLRDGRAAGGRVAGRLV